MDYSVAGSCSAYYEHDTRVDTDSAVVATPFDALRIGVYLSDGKINAVDFLSNDAELHEPASDAGRRAVDQLQQYFRNPAFRFSAPLAPPGTVFQQRVWSAMRDIPAGRVCTYGELALQLSTSPRAIGNACRRNPVPIIIPCHRVVAASGAGGFCGHTTGPMLSLKQRLLAHEHDG